MALGNNTRSRVANCIANSQPHHHQPFTSGAYVFGDQGDPIRNNPLTSSTHFGSVLLPALAFRSKCYGSFALTKIILTPLIELSEVSSTYVRASSKVQRKSNSHPQTSFLRTSQYTCHDLYFFLLRPYLFVLQELASCEGMSAAAAKVFFLIVKIPRVTVGGELQLS